MECILSDSCLQFQTILYHNFFPVSTNQIQAQLPPNIRQNKAFQTIHSQNLTYDLIYYA